MFIVRSIINKSTKSITLSIDCFFALLFFSVFLCSCEYPVKPDIDTFFFPTLGKELYSELGDPIISYTRAYTLPAIQTLEPIVYKYESYDLEIPPGRHVAFMENEHGTSYKSKIRVTQLGKTTEVWGGIFVPNTDSEELQIFFKLGGTKRMKIPHKISYLKTIQYQDARENFVQELVYNGKDQNTINFLYREYKGNMNQEAYSQEITYDFKPGELIEFRGTRFKILKADNLKIYYIVFRNFIEE